MKFLMLILAGLLACTGIIAQNACPEMHERKSNTRIHEQNSFGIRMAYNNTRATNISEIAKVSSLNRFQIGVFHTFYLPKNWFLKTDLIYNQKGNFYNDDDPIADGGKKVSIRLNYIEASIEAGYGIKIRGVHSIRIGFGPYLAYGINGTEKGSAETLYGRIGIDKKIEIVNTQTKEGTNLKIKPVDAGLNFIIAYQYQKYGMFVNYGLGLVNRENWGEALNRVASVGVSYSFR